MNPQIEFEIKNRIEQTLNVQIPKIGSSNHFLCDYGSNYIEIANIDAWIHKQITWIETNIIPEPTTKTNSLEFDNYIKDKIEEFKGKKDPINFNSRVLLLKNYTDIYKFYNVVLKNGKFTDVILIDEFQDTDMVKVELIIMLVKNNPNLFCVVAGDILQTIFVNNIGCKNFINPINYFKNKSAFYNELTIVGKPLTELFRLESISENEIKNNEKQVIDSITKAIKYNYISDTKSTVTNSDNLVSVCAVNLSEHHKLKLRQTFRQLGVYRLCSDNFDDIKNTEFLVVKSNDIGKELKVIYSLIVKNGVQKIINFSYFNDSSNKKKYLNTENYIISSPFDTNLIKEMKQSNIK